MANPNHKARGRPPHNSRPAPCRPMTENQLRLYRERQIPRDTRDLTAQLCGDPLPGRSALDRRHG